MSAGVEGNRDIRPTLRARPTDERGLHQISGTSTATAAATPNRSPETDSECVDVAPNPSSDEPRSPADGADGADGSQPRTPEPEASPDKAHDHHVLIDADEDRWKWRAKIRRDPRKLFFYRMAVALAGALLIVLAGITGPLPGPGGIPLALLGIAIWSSEFEWALKLMLWFKAQLARYLRWPLRRRVLFWVLVFVVGSSIAYTFLLVMGVPFWMPAFLRNALELLPGV